MGLMACVALACMTLLNQPYVYAEPASMEIIQPGTPMRSTPVNSMPRTYNGRQVTLKKFRLTDTIQLRFIDDSHRVDMDVTFKSEAEKPEDQRTIQSVNPFAFERAVRSFSCSGTGKDVNLNMELDPQYAAQISRWTVGPTKIFAIVIPHDYIDLKNNKECFSSLKNPTETVVKLVKNPRFLNAKRRNVVTFSVAKTDIWSQVNREQSVRIAHREMNVSPFTKRATAEEKGPLWNFEHDLSPATQNVNRRMTAENVKTNLDKSIVKGSGKQTRLS
jgi:hypothetical protein